MCSAMSSSRSPSSAMPDFAFEARHHGVAELAFVREVPIHRALVHARTRRDAANRQRPPVPDGKPVQELGAGRDDAFARLRGLLAADRTVVSPALPDGLAHRVNTGNVSHPRTVDVGDSFALS